MSLVLRTANGTTTVPESVLVGILVTAAESVEGAIVRRKRSVDVEAKTARLELTARRGEVLPQLAERVQQSVHDALQTMCGLDVRVDVAIEGLE